MREPPSSDAHGVTPEELSTRAIAFLAYAHMYGTAPDNSERWHTVADALDKAAEAYRAAADQARHQDDMLRLGIEAIWHAVRAAECRQRKT